MNKHTPGPWALVTNTGHTGQDGIQRARIACCEGIHLINVHQNVLGRNYSELTANARLIAAAPELLAACKALVKRIEHAVHDHPDDFWLGAEYQNGMAAIAKATGK